MVAVNASLFDSPAATQISLPPKDAASQPPPPPIKPPVAPPEPPKAKAPEPEVKKPEELKAGIADSEHKSETWLGFKDPTPHRATPSEVEQAALTREKTKLEEQRGEPTPPMPSPSDPSKAEPSAQGTPNASGAGNAPTPPSPSATPSPATPETRPQPERERPTPDRPPQEQASKPAEQPTPAEAAPKPAPESTSPHDGAGRDTTPPADERKPVEGTDAGDQPKNAPGGKPKGSADHPQPGVSATDPLGTASREQAAAGSANTIDKPQSAREVKAQDASAPAPAPVPAQGVLGPPTPQSVLPAATPTSPASAGKPSSPGAQPAPARPNLVPHVNPGTKRPGIQSQREADAASLKNAVEFDKFQLGRPRAGKGVEFQTVAPEWTTTTLATRHPKEAALELMFDTDGEVVGVRFLTGMSTGYADVDEPLEAACHRWKAKGEFFEKLKRENPKATTPLIIRVIFSE